MNSLFRPESMESRRRKFYGGVRLWQSNTYKIYLCAAIGAIPLLLAVAWATPYTEKFRSKTWR
jgi:hypothetical protein